MRAWSRPGPATTIACPRRRTHGCAYAPAVILLHPRIARGRSERVEQMGWCVQCGGGVFSIIRPFSHLKLESFRTIEIEAGDWDLEHFIQSPIWTCLRLSDPLHFNFVVLGGSLCVSVASILAASVILPLAVMSPQIHNCTCHPRPAPANADFLPACPGKAAYSKAGPERGALARALD